MTHQARSAAFNRFAGVKASFRHIQSSLEAIDEHPNFRLASDDTLVTTRLLWDALKKTVAATEIQVNIAERDHIKERIAELDALLAVQAGACRTATPNTERAHVERADGDSANIDRANFEGENPETAPAVVPAAGPVVKSEIRVEESLETIARLSSVTSHSNGGPKHTLRPIIVRLPPSIKQEPSDSSRSSLHDYQAPSHSEPGARSLHQCASQAMSVDEICPDRSNHCLRDLGSILYSRFGGLSAASSILGVVTTRVPQPRRDLLTTSPSPEPLGLQLGQEYADIAQQEDLASFGPSTDNQHSIAESGHNTSANEEIAAAEVSRRQERDERAKKRAVRNADRIEAESLADGLAKVSVRDHNEKAKAKAKKKAKKGEGKPLKDRVNGSSKAASKKAPRKATPKPGKRRRSSKSGRKRKAKEMLGQKAGNDGDGRKKKKVKVT